MKELLRRLFAGTHGAGLVGGPVMRATEVPVQLSTPKVLMHWVKVDPANPPAVHMIAVYSDSSGAAALTKFDDHPYMQAEDGWEMSDKEVAEAFSWWAPAPEGFVPHFMEVVPEEQDR